MSTTHVTAQREPAEALRQLCTLCPDFESWWNDEEVEDRLVDGVHSELTHHRLAMEFLDYCAGNHTTLSQQQLHAVGAWLNDAVAHDDELGEAVTTCFLHNCRAHHLDRVLAPYLSRQAKAKTHA